MNDPGALMSPAAAQIVAWVLIVIAWAFSYLRYGVGSFPFIFLAGIWFYLLFLPYATGSSDIRYGMTAFAGATYYLSVPVYTLFYAWAVKLVAPAAFRRGLISSSKRVHAIPRSWNWKAANTAFFFLSLLLCLFSIATRNVFVRDGDLLFTILGFDFILVWYLIGRTQRGPTANFILFIGLTLLFLYAGFRYRIAILFIAEIMVYISGRGSLIAKGLLVVGSVAAIFVLAAVGQVRTYGSFETLALLSTVEFDPMLLFALSGEQTVYFATVNIIENLDELETIGLMPIEILPAHFIPSAIWPDKPRATYIGLYLDVSEGLENSGAAMHDIAQATLMFGHLGLPIAALLLGFITGLFLRLGLKRSTNRYYTCALLVLCAFFVPSRGYLAQQVTWMLFFISPILLLHVAQRVTFDTRISRATRMF